MNTKSSETWSNWISWVSAISLVHVTICLLSFPAEHPSVKHSHSQAAIGVMAVKRTAQGAFIYFAHNTDSFVCLTCVLTTCS